MRIEERATWEREQNHMGGRGESFGTVPVYYGAPYRAVGPSGLEEFANCFSYLGFSVIAVLVLVVFLRVEGLENANAAQQLEIAKLKARVKKLEKLNQGRNIVDMDQDEGIELVVDHEKDAEFEGRHANKQAEIYNIDLDHSSKVLSIQEDDTEVQEAVEVVTTAKLITEVVTAATTQVIAASTPIFAAKPKILKIAVAPAVSTRRRKRVVIRDPEEELHTDTPVETPTVKDKGKGILIEVLKPVKKKDQVEMDAVYAKKLQEELDKEHEKAYKNIDWNAALDHV
nr:hypothetical protein [Tanacetum cinerariifolium]